MKPGTRSRDAERPAGGPPTEADLRTASRISRLCEECLRALEADRLEDFDELTDRLAALPRPDRAGTRVEIEGALEATRKLETAVGEAVHGIARELHRLREGKRALGGYRTPLLKDPRAVDLHA